MAVQANVSPKRPMLRWIVLAVLLFVLVAAIATVILVTLSVVPARVERSELSGEEPVLVRVVTPAEFAEHNGIEVLMLGVTAEGGLIDMRFRVTDAEKAAFLLEEANRPQLIVEDSGTVLTRHIRPEYKALENGRVYYLLFANAQSAILPGSLVTVELAGLRLEHLVAR